jgi:hypothetical protein
LAASLPQTEDKELAKKVSALDNDPKFSEYYSNTLAFIEYSKKYANWGNDHKKFLSKYPYV